MDIENRMQELAKQAQARQRQLLENDPLYQQLAGRLSELEMIRGNQQRFDVPELDGTERDEEGQPCSDGSETP